MTEPVFTRMPLDQLHESPFNPRRTFTDIEQLAADIKAQGVLQPLLVRPIVPPLFDAGADTQPEAIAGYEIVAGHRRFRASQLAGLADAPVLVRSMTDEQARMAQISENLSRKDVHPFEEAEGFAALMREHKLNVEVLVTMFGQSRSYIYGRLKLLAACPQVRDACLADEIVTEVALYISRLRTEKLQLDALQHIKSRNVDVRDGGKQSVRHIRALLADRYTLGLAEAIFDPKDAELVPPAGSCTSCPKLSGNAPEFEDLVADWPSRWPGHSALNQRPDRGDLCTDPDCFAAKKKAHLAREAARLQAEGTTVIAGNKAKAAIGMDGSLKSNGAFVPLKAVQAALKKVAGTAKPQIVVVQDQRSGKTHQAVARADLVAAGLIEADKPAKAAAGGQQRDHAAERRELEAKVEAENVARRRLLGEVRAAVAGRPRHLDELRIVLRQLLDDIDDADTCGVLRECWSLQHFGLLRTQLATMSGDELAALLLDIVITRDVVAESWTMNQTPEALTSMAELYGIDIEATRAGAVQTPAPAAEPLPTPSTAARAQGKPAAKGAGKGVKYRHPATGDTWSGKGLQPAWIKACLAAGKTLADLAVAKPAAPAAKKAGPAARKVKDGAGSAGEAARDTGTRDMLAEAGL